VFGGQFGVDRNFNDQLTLGLGFSYLRSDVDLNGNRGEFEGDTFRFGPYLGWTDARNKWFVDASLTYGFHDIDSERYIPEQDATASGSFNAHEILFYAGTGYPIDMNGFTLTPRASLQYLFLQHDGFTESGAGAADLQVHSRDAQSLRTRLGASIGRYFHAGTIVVQPELFLGWEYEALGDDDISANFAAGGDAFSVTPSAPGRSAAALAASVNFLFDENLSAFFRYEGRLSGDNDSHGLGAGFSLRF
ncbi:MAG: autotransporter outer membrane beta-barrel domain-containing protein, partial [Phycisphaeraceae bacterium]